MTITIFIKFLTQRVYKINAHTSTQKNMHANCVWGANNLLIAKIIKKKLGNKIKRNY